MSAADAPTGTSADDVEAEPTGEPTSAQDPVEAEQAGNAAGPEPEKTPELEKTTEPVAVPADDGVEIPRQQSAEEAADSEAGEGARA
ncbi:hypothetical protein [Streptomyces rishiriensis]|uniref:hypothetical protein n=1 Tax=Streptomyces rishiriensis TaxID=68264 RepID=UPI0027D892F8|nr:hypothetical protein [Streptomyces rishiriensis]